MARVTDVFISGTMGNIVLYRGIDHNYARLKRNGIKQTVATKIRSKNFGIASTAAAHLRRGLYAVIPFPTDRSMQSRFPGAIAKWLRLQDVNTLLPYNVVPCVTGFQFTRGEAFSERFRVPVIVSKPDNDIITVSVNAFIPVRNVVAPPGTVMMELVIAVAGCILKSGMPAGSGVQRIQVPYNNHPIAAQVLQFPVPVAQGSLTITAAWLQYYVLKNNCISRTENPAFMPAGIINARYA